MYRQAHDVTVSVNYCRMIRTLRKKHLQIWSILALALPVIIITGWAAVKHTPDGKLEQPAITNPLHVVVSSIHKTNYTVQLRSDIEKKSWQLEWINKEAITTPSALLYYAGTGNNELIGRIDGRGSYHFGLKATADNQFRFILYDIIHHQITDSINFTP